MELGLRDWTVRVPAEIAFALMELGLRAWTIRVPAEIAFALILLRVNAPTENWVTFRDAKLPFVAVRVLIPAEVKLAILDCTVPIAVLCNPCVSVSVERFMFDAPIVVNIELLGVCDPIYAGASQVYPVKLRSMPIPFCSALAIWVRAEEDIYYLWQEKLMAWRVVKVAHTHATMEYTHFLEDNILPAWELGDDFHAALMRHGTLAGSAAVQCILRTTDWWAGDLDIFVETEEAAAQIAATLHDYEHVWSGEAEGPAMEEVNENFAAAVNELQIYQRWMPFNGLGEQPFAGTAFAQLEGQQVRRCVKIYIGHVLTLIRTADLLHATSHYSGGEWTVASGVREYWTRDRFWSSAYRRAKWEGRGFRIA